MKPLLSRYLRHLYQASANSLKRQLKWSFLLLSTNLYFNKMNTCNIRLNPDPKFQSPEMLKIAAHTFVDFYKN